MKPIIDKILSFAISKKLTVFAVSVFLVLKETITGTEWIYVALVYIGTQGAIDLFNKIKSK